MVKIDHSGLRTWLEIDTKALKANYRLFKKIIGQNTKLLAVVKSNAYGHGIVETSQYLEKFGIDFLGVDSVVEAKTLRQNGVQSPILVFGFTLPEMVDWARQNNVSLTLSNFDFLKTIKLKKSNKKLKVHIKVETGLNRQGFALDSLPKLVKELSKNRQIEVEGVYTHFADAKNPKQKLATQRQVNIFNQAIDIFQSSGFGFITHASATSSSFIYPNAYFDMVRVGIGLYGLWPSENTKLFFEKKYVLKPALSWKTIITEIKDVKRGEKIGYSHSVIASKKIKLAICPIGYWHGYSRNLSDEGYLLVNGKKAKILGPISMDMIAIDITHIKDAKFNQEVTVIGRENSRDVTIDQLAKLSKTTNYEFVTRINPLIKRFYI